jgi:hypothetical protein
MCFRQKKKKEDSSVNGIQVKSRKRPCFRTGRKELTRVSKPYWGIKGSSTIRAPFFLLRRLTISNRGKQETVEDEYG